MKRTYRIAQQLIDTYRLHDDGAPVNLSPLHDVYPIDYRDLRGTGLEGFIVLPEGDPSPANPARVVLDEMRAKTRLARWIYAHEIAHAALGHGGSRQAVDVAHWFYDKDEHEALEVAAALLIPMSCFLDGDEVDKHEIARHCQVAPRFVDIHPGLIR